MSQHVSKYFATPKEAMLEQSATRMLAWATRWKMGIYQSVKGAKLLSKRLTIPIWKMWNPNQNDEPKMKVDKRRTTRYKPKKYKRTNITDKIKVTHMNQSTSKVREYTVRYFTQESMNDYTQKDYEPVLNDDLFGDAFND